MRSAILRLFDPNKMQQSTWPLSSSKFTDYILIPHVACKLIQEDLSCDALQAYLTMLESADVGECLYPEDEGDDQDDDAISRITRANFSRLRENISYDSDVDEQSRGNQYEIIERTPPLIDLSNQDMTGVKPRPRSRQRRLKKVQVLEIEKVCPTIISTS